MENLSFTKRFIGHLTTVNQHRKLVRKYCFKLGLYYQGLTHDLSKYSPVEFWSGVKYWQGYRSPINREKEVIGYSMGWLHHKGRNKHHWEYYIDHSRKGGLYVVHMPDKYVLESLCDRLAACKTYEKENYTSASALNYFIRAKDSELLDEDNKNEFIRLLTIIKDNEEDEAFRIIKEDYKKRLK